jgi:hypothetical protein
MHGLKMLANLKILPYVTHWSLGYMTGGSAIGMLGRKEIYSSATTYQTCILVVLIAQDAHGNFGGFISIS